MSVLDPVELTGPGPLRAGRRSSRLGWMVTGQGLVGSILLLFILAVAFIGPLVAPHSIAAPIGVPGAAPHSGAPLGTDFLGRDVLSRVLHGGLPVIWLSAATIALTYLLGLAIGMTAGLSRTILDPILMRVVDLLLVFPPLLLLLLLLAGGGTGQGIIILGIVLVLFPGVARLARTATLEVSTTGYIEAAVCRGESRLAIMRREVLPNIAQSILADFGVRFSAAIILSASINFLGLGDKPPAANWGLMVAENRPIVSTNPLALVVPAVMLAMLTIAINLLSDAYIHRRSRRAHR
jgi:peptide/nickel transport system permease protein